MEIDAQQPSIQATTPQVKPLAQESPNVQQNGEAEDTTESSTSTLQLSETGLSLSLKETNTTTENSVSTEISNNKNAQQSAAQFKEDAANDPSLTQNAQANNVTSKLVQNLIG